MVHSPNSDTDFFDIIAGVLQGDTQAPYLFIIYLDYILRMSIDLIKENGLTLYKIRSRWYPVETIMGCRLHKWSSTSCKHTCTSQMSAA